MNTTNFVNIQSKYLNFYLTFLFTYDIMIIEKARPQTVMPLEVYLKITLHLAVGVIFLWKLLKVIA